MDYMTLKEAGEKWNISLRIINCYFSADRISAQKRKGRPG